MLQSMRLQRIGHNLATEQQQQRSDLPRNPVKEALLLPPVTDEEPEAQRC